MKESLWKDYLHVFKIPFILLGVLAIVSLGCALILGKEDVVWVRGNTLQGEERVFDYADKLTAEEEEALRERIRAAQEKTGCDIVIVILEESLEEYAKAYEAETGPLDPSQYVMVYANNFYDENQFGFDAPLGDGIILVDNWYRESDGGLYSWISPSGRIWNDDSQFVIDLMMDGFIEVVQVDPYSGYEYFVEMAEDEFRPGGGAVQIPGFLIPVAAAIVALIFFFANYGGRKGRKTVEVTTYVRGQRPNIRVKEDQFLTKTVTKRKIQTSSGSSGGGGGGGARISRGGGGRR